MSYAGPARQRDLKRGEQGAEQRRAVAAGEFPGGLGDFGGKMCHQPLMCARRGVSSFERPPKRAITREVRSPKRRARFQLRRLPERALGGAPRSVAERHGRQGFACASKPLEVGDAQFLHENA